MPQREGYQTRIVGLFQDAREPLTREKSSEVVAEFRHRYAHTGRFYRDTGTPQPRRWRDTFKALAKITVVAVGVVTIGLLSAALVTTSVVMSGIVGTQGPLSALVDVVAGVTGLLGMAAATAIGFALVRDIWGTRHDQ